MLLWVQVSARRWEEPWPLVLSLGKLLEFAMELASEDIELTDSMSADLSVSEMACEMVEQMASESADVKAETSVAELVDWSVGRWVDVRVDEKVERTAARLACLGSRKAGPLGR